MDLAVAFVYAIGSVICHQLPDRSFFVNGGQLPVCARCTGLYLSGCAGFVAWIGARVAAGWRPPTLAVRRVVWFLAIVAMPTIVSFACGVLGIWDGSNVIRAALAVPLGLTAGAVVAAVCTKDLR